jgi:UDP:flavonoid glycosyltransferase YjiC (YdhE family)
MRILFTTLPSNDLGLLTRSLPVAQELVPRGHSVAFASPGAVPKIVIAEAGFINLIPEQPVSAPPKELPAPTAEMWDVDHAFTQIGFMDEQFVRAGIEHMLTILAEYRPDIVVDSWNALACIAAKAARIPVASLLQADVHPLSRGFIWWKEPTRPIPSPVPSVNKVLARYGLHPIDKMGELLVGDVPLVLGTPESDPLPEEAHVTYIGAILWQNPRATMPSWLADLDKGKPVVWVYTGNPRYSAAGPLPYDSAVVPQACIEALKDEDVSVVLTTGHQELPEVLLPLPANFRYAPFVPGLAMARRSDVLIHHGGYGSCQTGLFTGTPAVIVPTYSERESNARRVAALGAGEWVDVHGDLQKHVDAAELRAKVKLVLANPAYNANAGRFSQRLQSFGGAVQAADVIEANGGRSAS